jgi:hypothetical protein
MGDLVLTWLTTVIYRFAGLFAAMSRTNMPLATSCPADCATHLLVWPISWITHCLVTESSMSKLPHTLLRPTHLYGIPLRF